MLFGKARFAVSITRVPVHQGPAWADVTRPCHRHRSAFNKVAHIVRPTPVITCKTDIASAVEGFGQRGLCIFVEIYFGKAELWQHRRRQIRNIAHCPKVETIILHIRRGGLDVAHRIISGTKSMAHLDDLWEVCDIPFHCDKSNTDLRFWKVPALSHFEKALQVINDHRKFCSHSDIAKTIRRSSVQRYPKHIEPSVD